ERARRNAFGGQAHQDMIVRLKLRQAFGRLIRSKSDRGAFVVLDPRLASRFCTVFPEGVVPERLGLVDAIEAVESFLRPALADHGRSLERAPVLAAKRQFRSDRCRRPSRTIRHSSTS